MRTAKPASSAAEVPARTRLLDAAERLMLSVGYVDSSVEEICAAAGVTKGSFFHHFKSKEQLGKVLLERFAARQQDRFAAVCEEIEDPLERVYALIDLAIRSARDPATKGCLVGTLAQEISESHPELREVCKCCFEGFAASVGADLVAAKERHAPNADFDAASLGPCFLSLAQGSMLLLRTNGDREAMARNLEHFRRYLRSLYWP
jgi:TetR/AcrR family transcriptional repressor of nem operon